MLRYLRENNLVGRFLFTIKKMVNAVSGFICPLCMKIKTYLFHKHFDSSKQVKDIKRSIQKDIQYPCVHRESPL